VHREPDRSNLDGQCLDQRDQPGQPGGVVDVRRPVRGDQHAGAPVRRHRGQTPLAERVDHRVADHEHPLGRDPLGGQQCGRPRGRGEVKLGRGGGDPPVQLLDAALVEAAQPGLEVSECDTGGPGGQRVGRHRFGVAEGQHQVGPVGGDRVDRAGQQRPAAGRHPTGQPELDVRRQLERARHVGGHRRVVVLSDVDGADPVTGGPQRPDHRSELDHLRAGAERDEQPAAHPAGPGGPHGRAGHRAPPSCRPAGAPAPPAPTRTAAPASAAAAAPVLRRSVTMIPHVPTSRGTAARTVGR